MSTTDETTDEQTTMATDEQADAPVRVAPASTFKERLAARRRELEENTTFEIPVNGYPDLWCRYRVLGFEEIREIGSKVEREVDDQITGERYTAATTLAEACVELLEFGGEDDRGKPIFVSTGCKWSAKTAGDLFEIDLPDGVNARDALMSIFPYPRDLLMMQHFEDYIAGGMNYLPEIERLIQGESPAASAATTSD